MRAFIDSNIFIYAAQSHPRFGKKCRQIIEDIENEKIVAITSSLNISEVGEVISRYVGKEEAIKAVELVSALPMSIEPVTKENSIDAISIYCKYNINYADAIIVSVMQEKFVDTIITNDKHFDKVKGIEAIKPNRYKTREDNR
jgi:predicted nucleic acid-binding protein